MFRRWGFSARGWRDGKRGEYWLLAQIVLLVVFVGLPTWPGAGATAARAVGLLLIAAGVLLASTAIRRMGRSLTPLPHPPDESRLVTGGVYAYVRHPIYGSVVLMTLGTAIALWSLTHLAGTLVLLLFFDAKARREEAWLNERFPDYAAYAQRVKKLLPGIY